MIWFKNKRKELDKCIWCEEIKRKPNINKDGLCSECEKRFGKIKKSFRK